MFPTHVIRPQTELSESLWEFTPLDTPKPAQSRPVFVPGCWESLPGLHNYRGRGLYSRRFTGGGNLRFEFKGVSHTANIYLDGVLLTRHYNAYTPFSATVTSLPRGEHLLEVLADNRFGPDSALHVPNDYMTYGGINRPVVMEEVSDAYLEYVHYTPVCQGGEWSCRVEACVTGLAPTEPLDVEIRLNGAVHTLGRVCPAPGETMFLRGEIPAGTVRPWTPGDPALYPAAARLVRGHHAVDDLLDRVGFRTVEVRGRQILLNGQPIRIRGLCRHEDWEGFGCALTPALMQRDLAIFRDLGANAVRTTHYPNDERFLDLCDEQGFLVWEENHARGLTEQDMRNPNFERQCEDCNAEMVRAHYNHPCIFVWGILNECASHTEYGRACYRAQLEQLRALDPGRPLTFATCQFRHDGKGEGVALEDICMDLPDVAALNVYPLWYFDCSVPRFLKQVHDALSRTPAAEKPFLVSEIGAGAEYGFHADAEEKWSEEYQAAALEQQLNAVLADPLCTGVFIWQYADVRVSREWFANRPRCHNNKGVVDGYRRPKLAYRVVRELFCRDAAGADEGTALKATKS